jgi:serine/threonine-protein kinase
MSQEVSEPLTLSPQEQRLAELLDRYVTSLSQPEACEDSLADLPEELLTAFPELSSLLDCLDSLEALSPEPLLGPAGVASSALGETLVPDKSDPVARSLSGDLVARDFGRYELCEEIGRGGMGIVYRARQKALGSSVALKLMRSHQFATDEEVSRFYAEARAAAALKHPNIVCVHDVGEHLGQHFLTMDLVGGQSLAGRLAQEPLPPREAATLLAAVARAVEYLHQHQVIHRDLKPSNILLDDDGQPHVADFGLAKVFAADNRETTSGTILGTPSYMAPEQAAGHSRRVTPRSDVYSLGAILYEMLTGRPPFHADNPLDTVLQVLEVDPPPLRREHPEIPAELESICLRCLEKAPERRISSAVELADELERYLAGEPSHIPPRTLWQRLQRWTRREPGLVSRLAVLAVATIILQINYHVWEGIPPDRHLGVLSVIGLWLSVSFVCQRLLLSLPRQPGLGLLTAWAAADAGCFTGILALAEGPVGPLVVGYPVLIAVAGLWVRVRLVWLMTVFATASYVLLTVVRADPGPAHYPFIFAATLIGTGGITAYQVGRLRALSRYFEQQLASDS